MIETKDIKRAFIEAYYGGDYNAYKRARKEDYLATQYEWSVFIDGLCKDGLITQEQYENVLF